MAPGEMEMRAHRGSLLAIALGLLTVAWGGWARADEQVGFVEVDENAERRARAADLLARHRYTEALDVYRAAYAAHHQPALLFLIGCTAQVANRARLAEHYFRRYLEDAPDGPPERRTDAARRLANLRALIEEGQKQWTPEAIELERQRREQAAAAWAIEAERSAQIMIDTGQETVEGTRRRRSRANAPLSVGLSMLVVSRAFLTAGGILLLAGDPRLDEAYKKPNGVDGLLTFIPVAGGIASAAHTGGGGAEGLWAAYAGVNAGLEAVGLALVILGGMDLARARRDSPEFAKILVMPSASPTHGGLVLTGSF